MRNALVGRIKSVRALTRLRRSLCQNARSVFFVPSSQSKMGIRTTMLSYAFGNTFSGVRTSPLLTFTKDQCVLNQVTVESVVSQEYGGETAILEDLCSSIHCGTE